MKPQDYNKIVLDLDFIRDVNWWYHFMSGYTANVIAHRGVLEDGVCFIPKPFSKKEMAVKVRNVLNGDIDKTVG